jgi:phosphoglycerate kinase
MNLPKLMDLEVGGKRVMVRADLDVPITKIRGEEDKSEESGGEYKVEDDNRLRLILPTIKWLLESGAMVVLCGHLGRPGRMENGSWKLGGEEREKFSLFPVGQQLLGLLGEVASYKFSGDFGDPALSGLVPGGMVLLENLRFDPGESIEATLQDKERLADKLIRLAEVYVNESFAESHRGTASIVGVPGKMKTKNCRAAGMRLAEEVEVLSGVLEKPVRPLVVVVGGAKLESKLPVISKMEILADRVLVGGKLPAEIAAKNLKFSEKVLVASLAEGGKDIDQETIETFRSAIEKAGTVVWSGPMGMFEVEGSDRGTAAVAEAIAKSEAMKIAGGGDTEAAIKKSGLSEKFDWISVGGGAMLQFLAEGTLPGIEALK